MKVLLSVFSVRILQHKNEQLLSKFGGNIDFLPLFHKFNKHIHKNVQHWKRDKYPTQSLTCPSYKKIILLSEERCLYGSFDAGRDGDFYKVKNYNEVKPKVKIIRPKDSTLRNAFFYLSVPKLSKKAYLVLQVPEGKGIKHVLEHFLREYFNSQGLQQYHVEITNSINEKVFYTMIDNGLLKDLTFTRYGIPETTDGMKNSEDKPQVGTGSVKTIYHDNNLGKRYRDYVKSIFAKKRMEKEGDTRSVIEFDDIKANELSIKIEYQGKQKTFHVENFGRTLPDIDVTSEVVEKNEIVLEKMIAQSRVLIDEVNTKVKKSDITN